MVKIICLYLDPFIYVFLKHNVQLREFVHVAYTRKTRRLPGGIIKSRGPFPSITFPFARIDP